MEEGANRKTPLEKDLVICLKAPGRQYKPGPANSGKGYSFNSLLTNSGAMALVIARTGLDLHPQEPSIDLEISPDIVTWR